MTARRSSVRVLSGHWIIVGVAIGWNLLNLRAELRGVSYLDDSSVHEQMVRFATAQFRSGHVPLTSWFPFLGLGSPQFLHYQSLPAMLAGLIGLATGPDAAFRWTLYMLLSFWPLSIYVSARLFGAGRWAAAAAAALSPFLMSATGVGYEEKAYVWVGYGVWAQLWASFTLPLAWGLSWRAIRDGRNFFGACVLVSLTVALHFETGYLAIMPILLWPFVARRSLVARLARGAFLACGVLLASAWVIVPLLEQRSWAATNEVLRGTPLVNGYGAPRVLGWLASGQLLDAGRVPVVTTFAGIGLVLACAAWRSDENKRVLVIVLAACLLLSFGRTTFGPLADAIPGSGDIFFRRFMMGIQLAALLLAGQGAAWCARRARDALDGSRLQRIPWLRALQQTGPARLAITCLAAIALLTPAWSQLMAFDQHNAAAIDAQRRADISQGVQVDRLIDVVDRSGGGRVYAGMPSNWGMHSTVGAVPVFKYLESRDLDEVGYTLRTASLMTDPEYFFDERNPSDYFLFGVHFLILPLGQPPPIPARLMTRIGTYSLWRSSVVGYTTLGRIVGRVSANRSNVGVQSIPVLRSHLAQEGNYIQVSWGRLAHATSPGPSTQHPLSTSADIGSVVAERDSLPLGSVTATIGMRQAGVAVLSTSFDPGWTVSVDGHRNPSLMVAPSLVATLVPAGIHRIAFRYEGFGGYLSLAVLLGVSLSGLLTYDVLSRRRLRVSRTDCG